MHSVSSAIYNKEYYLRACHGFEEFEKSNGKKVPARTKYLLSLANIQKGTRVLDLGCGRGDATFYAAKLGAKAVGIDYAKDAIEIAKNTQKKQPQEIKKNTSFLQMDAKLLDFEDNTFDTVIAIDVFEHLYKEELEVVLEEIVRVLRKNGTLLVHVEPNIVYLNITHRFYVYPVSQFLIWINRFFTKKTYPGLPKDPRNDYHREQHVNEPTYFYLQSLFQRHSFTGKILPVVSYVK